MAEGTAEGARPHHGGDEDEVTVWLRRQCARHDVLQPEQQNLLADIGIASAVARAVTDAGQNPACVDTGLAHARSYAAEHGHLAVSKHTRRHGFALGRWLIQQRRKARAGLLSARTLQELTLLAPWWNPP
ncbi:helicase associated domain-containing protein, partial [Streptomyces albiflaviniger]|nr:helicase associated domain-containing protein [Streptomyces albiflaviniger]